MAEHDDDVSVGRLPANVAEKSAIGTPNAPSSWRPEDVTPQSLPQILRDKPLRTSLLAALKAEQGSVLPLHCRVSESTPKCQATTEELDELVGILLREDETDRFLRELVFHPSVSDQTLFRVLDAGRCIDSLGHRAGPEQLLLRLAREHKYPEAILTLALYTYALAAVSEEQFLSFVREHIGLKWLRSSIRRRGEARFSGHKRKAALELIDDHERSCQ
jgi:hypothetical protein